MPFCYRMLWTLQVSERTREKICQTSQKPKGCKLIWGQLLKWWVSPTIPWVFLLHLRISTWGGDWGYHHLTTPVGTAWIKFQELRGCAKRMNNNTGLNGGTCERARKSEHLNHWNQLAGNLIDIKWEMYNSIRYMILAGKDKTSQAFGVISFLFMIPTARLFGWSLKNMFIRNQLETKTAMVLCSLKQSFCDINFGKVSWESSNWNNQIQLSRGCLRSEVGIHSETLGRYPGTRKEVQYPFLKVEKNYIRESWELCQTSLDTSQPFKKEHAFYRYILTVQCYTGCSKEAISTAQLRAANIFDYTKGLRLVRWMWAKKGQHLIFQSQKLQLPIFHTFGWKWSELSEWKTSSWRDIFLYTFPGGGFQPIWKIWVNWQSSPNMDENKNCLSCHHLVSSWQTSQESLTKFCKIVATSQAMTHFLVGQAACSCASTKPPERRESWKGSAQRW